MTAAACPLEIASLRTAFLSGAISATQLVDRVLAQIAEWDDPAIWISRSTESSIRARARELDAQAAADPSSVERLPLFGIPFAVKDNIDVAGLPTTAGCPAFAYTPSETAPVVARLLAAGAVLFGKTNLDQFAQDWSARARPTGCRATPSTRASFPAARARARRWPSQRASSALPSAPTQRDRGAFPLPSTTSSG